MYCRLLPIIILWCFRHFQPEVPPKNSTNQEVNAVSFHVASMPITDSTWYYVLDSAKLHRDQGDFDHAIKQLQSIPERSLTDTALLAEIAHQKGVVRFNMEHFEESIKQWRAALDWRLSKTILDTTAITKGFRNIGYTHFLLENYEAAKDSLTQALDWYSHIAEPEEQRLATIYRELGEVNLSLGDINSAQSQILTAFEMSASFEPWERGLCFTSCFNLYYEISDFEKALVYLEDGLQLYLGMEEKFDEDYLQISDFYNNLGIFYINQNQWDAAILNYQKAAQINQRYPYRAKQLDVNYFNIADLYYKQAKYALALKYIDQAIEIQKDLQEVVGLAENYDLKAKVYWQKGDLKNALLWNQKAMQLIVPHLKEEAIPGPESFVVHKLELIEILYNRAAILQEKPGEKALFQASAIYDSLSLFIEGIRLQYESDQTKAFFAESAKNIFQSAVDLNVQLYDKSNNQVFLAKAFEYTEHAKAVILLDALNDSEAKQYAGVPKVIVAEGQQLKKAIAHIEKALMAFPDSADLRNELILQNRALEAYIDQLENQYPDYANLKYHRQSISLANLQAQLKDTIVSYFLGKKSTYAFLLNSQELDIVVLGAVEALPPLIEALREGLYGQQTGGEYAKRTYDSLYVQGAHQLYQYLFEPLVHQFDLPEKMTIIPDGMLGFVPFESLLTALPEKPHRFGSHTYLLKQYQISYAYSTALLEEMQYKVHRFPSQKVLIFEPEFGLHPNDPLRPLVSASQDLKKIIGGKVIEKEEATLERFTEEAANYQIIHLGTHGLANDTMGDYGYLAFTFLPDSLDNELLYTRDLYNLSLNADIVVLSACETGVGELQEGEGIISLARGFSYAGAKSIITTLWQVNDESTNELLQSFYTAIKGGNSIDLALQQAKLDFIDQKGHEAHPFYWAGFVGVGDMGALEFGSNRHWWWAWFLLLPVVGGYFWIRRK